MVHRDGTVSARHEDRRDAWRFRCERFRSRVRHGESDPEIPLGNRKQNKNGCYYGKSLPSSIHLQSSIKHDAAKNRPALEITQASLRTKFVGFSNWPRESAAKFFCGFSEKILVGARGFEPPTSRSRTWASATT